MGMDRSVMMYLQPTEAQRAQMAVARQAFDDCLRDVESCVPEGPDRTYLVRKLRECAMWANVAITRHADGSPRRDPE